MNEAEKILEKFARKNMVEWNQQSFKRTHSRLHKSIIEAISEALTIPVVGRSELLVCDEHDHDAWSGGTCRNCGALDSSEAN